jgi:phosphatidylinositol alpha-mannosyltransferase
MRGEAKDPDFVRRVGRSRVIYSNGAFARITTGWRLTDRLVDLLRETRAEVVHVQDGLAPVLGPWASDAAWRLDLPVVATFHSWFSWSFGYWAFRPLFQRRLDRIAASIAVSEPVVRALSRYLQGEWEIIPNGVDLETFHPNGAVRGGAPRLLFLGRLDPRNGLGTVLEALPRVLDRFPGTELVVAGDGPLRSFYERQARHLGAHVRFVGHVNGERPDYYDQADLYLCPTTKASFGITLLEAMACGTPLVVSDITGFRELVGDGQEAQLVDKDDPAAWSEAVVRLIDDPTRRAAMGQAGLVKASRYAWPVVTDRVLDVYRRVVGA